MSFLQQEETSELVTETVGVSTASEKHFINTLVKS